MSRDLKVFWTENTVQDLLGIKTYIAQDSIDRAGKWHRYACMNFYFFGGVIFRIEQIFWRTIASGKGLTM